MRNIAGQEAQDLLKDYLGLGGWMVVVGFGIGALAEVGLLLGRLVMNCRGGILDEWLNEKYELELTWYGVFGQRYCAV